jgi:hypothetical protein
MKERSVTDGTDIVLLEKHGHSKVVIAGVCFAERRTPAMDEPIRPPFRRGAFRLGAEYLMRLALVFRVDVDRELVGFLPGSLRRLRNIYPKLVRLMLVFLPQTCLTTPHAASNLIACASKQIAMNPQ